MGVPNGWLYPTIWVLVLFQLFLFQIEHEHLVKLSLLFRVLPAKNDQLGFGLCHSRQSIPWCVAIVVGQLDLSLREGASFSANSY